jgi:predicted RNase H-like nuclease
MDQIDLVTPQRSTVIFGFDSAWTDAPRAPGAICAIAVDDRGDVRFHEPRLASFAQARAFIDGLRKGFAVSLVALDQPTVVPNAAGSRPVDKVAASLVSFVGGGVQPANRSKTGMFCDDAPVWAFLSAVDATQDPLRARTASAGHFVIEVFPALALPALEDGFAGRLRAPKYNPQNRKKFRLEDWQAVAGVVARSAERLGVQGLADWARHVQAVGQPRKSDQDRLDAALCALVGLGWRAGPTARSAMLGDVDHGYMVTPISDATWPRLQRAALRRAVPTLHVLDPQGPCQPSINTKAP